MDIVIYFELAVHFSDGDIGPHKIFQAVSVVDIASDCEKSIILVTNLR